MHRNDLLALLDQYRTPFIAEAGFVEQTKRFVNEHEDCFHSRLLPGHVTGSAWVVNPTRDKALLLHHRKRSQWFQPGGHADRDTDIRRVAIRETAEESGLDPQHVRLLDDRIFDIDIHDVPDTARFPRHRHYDIRFLLEIDDALEITGNDESHQVLWVPLRHTAHFNRNLSTHRMMEKTRRMNNPHAAAMATNGRALP